MKKLFLLAAIICSTIVSAQETTQEADTDQILNEIFFQGTWEEAKQKALAEGKYLFVDTYTDWCYWCKVMDKKTFPNERVATMLKQKFVAYKMDMEKDYGVIIAKKYRVSSYPSYLLFDREGVYVNKMVGYYEVEEFLSKVKEAINPENTIKNYIGRGTPEELTYPSFYHNSFLPGKQRVWPTPEEVEAFLVKQDDIFDEVSWGVMSRFTLTSAMNKKFLENREVYIKNFGKLEVDNKINSIISRKASEAAKAKDEAMLEEAIDMQRKYVDDASDYDPHWIRMSYYLRTENMNDYFETASALKTKEQMSNSAINGVCWNIYLHSDNFAHTEQALIWMEEVCETDRDYAYMDTYAALAFKAKEYDRALELAKEAIEIGIENKEKVDGTRELVQKINAAMQSE